jgi:anti-sigma regulatory factor (Ser/Thr protein kinase)
MASRATFRVAGVPSAVAKAREAVNEAASDRMRGELLETARLLVSELVTNGIIHGRAGEPLDVSLQFDNGTVRVEVADRGPGFAPQPRATVPDQHGGWGLYLVDQLADRWGVARDDHTRVWFELKEKLPA